MRGGHMPLNSEVLKHRFWRYLKKSGPPLCYQWQMRHTFGQVLDDFFALFRKKVKLHIPGAFAPLPCTVYLVLSARFDVKEGGPTSAPKPGSNHRNQCYICYSVLFICGTWLQTGCKCLETFFVAFSNQNTSKSDWNLWSDQLNSGSSLPVAWKQRQKTIMWQNPRKIFQFSKI